MKRIGVTAFYERTKSGDKNTYLSGRYVECVACLGYLPLLIPITEHYDHAEEYVKNIDVLLVTGGCDVNPINYDEEPSIHMNCASTIRDTFEECLIKAAVKRNIPIVGICRGMQIINYVFGGTVIQDIPSEVPNALCHRQNACAASEKIHSIKVLPSILSDILGEKAYVNSYHHQSVKTLGKGFEAIAFAPDGVCEAMVNKEKRIIAFQWHPEKLFDTDENQRKMLETAFEL